MNVLKLIKKDEHDESLTKASDENDQNAAIYSVYISVYMYNIDICIYIYTYIYIYVCTISVYHITCISYFYPIQDSIKKYPAFCQAMSFHMI